jgi:cytochrome c oxidase subunit II
MAYTSSPLAAPPRNWWEPAGREEKLWIGIAAVWAVSMFVMMVFIWPAIGSQQNFIQSYRVEPGDFSAYTAGFIEEHQTDEIEGVPVVSPPPGSDVFLQASQFQWTPVLELQRGETYRILISSIDVQHGFSVQPGNVNFQVLPEFITGLEMTPEETGEYTIVCNEFCGLGHHLMVGRIIVVD